MFNYLKIFILFIITFTAAELNADMLITNSGQELKGAIVSIDKDSVTISIDSEEQVFNKKDLLRIEFTKDTPSKNAVPLSNLDDDILKSNVLKKVSPDRYQDAGHITLLSEISYTYTNDKQFIASYRNIVQVLKERGKDEGIVNLSFKKDIQTAEIKHGRTVNTDADGGSALVYDYDQSSLRESSMFYRYPDYDSIKSMKFPLPNIVVGSVLDYAFSTTQHKIDVFEPVYKEVYFSGDEPVLKKRLIIKFPKGSEDVNISLNLMGTEGSDYTVTREDAGEYTVVTYEKDNIEATKDESYMPSDALIMPRVTLSVSPGFKEISKELSKKLNDSLVISDEIKSKVDELTKGADSAEDKIFNIYQYIVREISLIPISVKHYSYIPKKSDYLFSKKSGSYLDKSFLFYTFLRAAGIDCSFALVKGRRGGGLLEGNPSVKQFSSPLVVIPVEAGALYISALNKNLMLSDIESSSQGGQGLIISKEGGERFDVPLRSADDEKTLITFNIDLNEDGSVRIKETKRLLGNSQGQLRMIYYLPEKRLKQYLIERTYGIHPNAELIDYRFDNLNDLRKAPSMEINYLIKDYMIAAGGKLFAFQLPSLSYSAYGVGKSERNFPLYFGRLMSSENEYTINLPDNYDIYYLPEEYSYKSVNFVYEASYKRAGDNKVIFKDSYKRFTDYAEKEVYFELKECLETRAKLAKEWIVIERKQD